MSLAAIQREVDGRAIKIASPTLGEAKLAGEQWAERLAELLLVDGPTVAIAGGETTVTLGDAGESTGAGDPRNAGGRSQELALAFALAVERLGLDKEQTSKQMAEQAPVKSWVFLSAGTDGIDGPTDAAGALVDGQTLSRCRAEGIDPNLALERHDSYRALNASGDLVRTGATGTNVADVQVLLIG